jgi:hypothetical protein
MDIKFPFLVRLLAAEAAAATAAASLTDFPAGDGPAGGPGPFGGLGTITFQVQSKSIVHAQKLPKREYFRNIGPRHRSDSQEGGKGRENSYSYLRSKQPQSLVNINLRTVYQERR